MEISFCLIRSCMMYLLLHKCYCDHGTLGRETGMSVYIRSMFNVAKMLILFYNKRTLTDNGRDTGKDTGYLYV